MKNPDKDLYKILGVDTTASADQIKRAYRERAKRYHPDRTGGDKAKEARFKELGAAYEVLSDPKKRAQYDAMRRGGFPSGGEGFDFSSFAGIHGVEDLFTQIFGPEFGAAAARAQARRGPRVVFEQRATSGDPFGAFGFDPFGGAARSRGARPAPPPDADQPVRAPDGTTLTRRGDDIHGDVEVTIEEAVLGARIEVSTLDGRVTVGLPAGTSSGQKLRLRGKGARRADGNRGHHYAHVKIVVPARVDEHAAELLREFSRRAPVRPRR